MRILLFLLPALVCAQSSPSNLGFENGKPGELPPGWTVPPVQKALGYWAEFRREGCRDASGCAVMLAPTAQAAETFGNLTRSFDAKPYRGKTVRLRAYVRVAARAGAGASPPADHAQIWFRVDLPRQEMGFFDDMGDRPISSSQWASYEITGEVAADAETISIGIMSFGRSPVWVDGVSIEILPAGAVNPQLGAARTTFQKLYERIDAAYGRQDMDAVASLAVSDAQIQIGTQTLKLSTALLGIMSEMEKGFGYTSKSTVTDVRPSGNLAIVSVNNEAIRTAPGTSAEGKQILVSANRDTWIKTRDGWRLKESVLISTRTVTPPTDTASAAPVISELKQRAVTLTTTDPNAGFDDLAAFGAAVGNVPIVALGDATHGTREFFQLKHRMLEYLVTHKGFSIFALEASWPEALAIDHYIKTGDGNARSALAALYSWTWNTEELLDLIEWMRSYNQAPGNHPILTVSSFDMQVSRIAAPMVLDYLGKYSPGDVGAAAESYTQAQMLDSRRTQVYDDQAKALAERAAAVVRVLDAKRRELIAASSPEAWTNARHAAEVIFQSCSMRIPDKGPLYRDEAMATNVSWLLQTHPNEKMILWAHNDHVGFDWSGGKSMGVYLRERYGRQMYVVGFAFRRGRLRAVGTEQGKVAALSVYDAAPSPEGSGDSILSAAGLPMFFLDLANVPTGGPLARWLGASHLFHDVSGNWAIDQPDANLEPKTLSKQYDGLIFVEETHESRSIEK